MNYSLSFCEITQLSENIFEAVENEDVVIDGQCVMEAWNFWNQLRTEPFGLLVICSELPLSFLGAQKIGDHPLQQKTALLLNKVSQERKLPMQWILRKLLVPPSGIKFFIIRQRP